MTQETLFRVYKGWEGFRKEASVKTWVFKIAVHVGLNSLRDQNAGKRRGLSVPIESVDRDLEAGASIAGAPSPFDALQQRELAERVRAAIFELPPQMRRCVLMYVDQQLKYREIAAAMRISEGAVKSQIHEARQRLKTMFRRGFGGDES